MACGAAARARAAVPFVDLILSVFHLFYFDLKLRTYEGMSDELYSVNGPSWSRSCI
jgi:hypothetical protein